MAKQKNVTESEVLHIDPLKQGRLKLRVIGTTELYFNSMNAKVMRDLLIGTQRKTAAERKNIKHDPEHEYRMSVYTKATGPTLLTLPAPAFKSAMATAALVTNGVKRTDVNRLVFLPSYSVPIWGRPYLKMDVVRSADINRTPDVRTRAFLPRWCAEIGLAYVTQIMSAHGMASLLANSGVVCGVGDFRQEKGKGSFGTYRIVSEPEDEKLWDELTTKEGRACQVEAMENPVGYDEMTRDLLAAVRQERMRRVA